LVYLVDQTDNLIIEIDTNIGVVVKTVAIADGATTGNLAISVDDSTLYLAESAEDKILVFSLPDLTPQASIPLNFSPGSIAPAVNGRLFASLYQVYEGVIVELNTSTGNILQTFATTERYYDAPLLRTNAAGTNLYAGSQDATAGIYEYNITGVTASSATKYAVSAEDMADFAPDETYNRIYLMSGGIYGVNIINTITGNDATVWSTNPYGAAVAYPPSGTMVVGASTSDVKYFNRTDGTPVTDNTVSGASIVNGGLAVTPNGNAVYVEHEFTGSGYITTVGIVGLAHFSPVPIAPTLFYQNGTSLGTLTLNTSFLPSAWKGVGGMGAGWQERAIADINGDGVPDIIFQDGTLIGALTMNASGTPKSWIGIGSMGAGWQLRGAAYLTNDGNLDLIFQDGTLLGYLEVSKSGVPVSWNGIGAMGTGWELRAVACLDGTGQPDLIFQNGTALGALQVNTSGVPTAWVGIGAMSSGWTLAAAVDVNEDDQPDLIFQNGTALGALQVNTSYQPVAWHGIGAMSTGWTLPGDY